MQPAATISARSITAGGLPAVMHELMAPAAFMPALTVNGKTMGENVAHATIADAT